MDGLLNGWMLKVRFLAQTIDELMIRKMISVRLICGKNRIGPLKLKILQNAIAEGAAVKILPGGANVKV